jgi:hypothetical protein
MTQRSWPGAPLYFGGRVQSGSTIDGRKPKPVGAALMRPQTLESSEWLSFFSKRANPMQSS